jgi:IMP dehydrogenase
MLGSLLAGVDESTGRGSLLHQGERYKGVHGARASMAPCSPARSPKDRILPGPRSVDTDKPGTPRASRAGWPIKGPFGKRDLPAHRGPAGGHGLRGRTPPWPSMQAHARFVRHHERRPGESHPHYITITKEAPNYGAGDPGEELLPGCGGPRPGQGPGTAPSRHGSGGWPR